MERGRGDRAGFRGRHRSKLTCGGDRRPTDEYRLATPFSSPSVLLPPPSFLARRPSCSLYRIRLHSSSFKWHRLSRIEKGIKNGRSFMRKTMLLQTIPLPICLGITICLTPSGRPSSSSFRLVFLSIYVHFHRSSATD